MTFFMLEGIYISKNVLNYLESAQLSRK